MFRRCLSTSSRLHHENPLVSDSSANSHPSSKFSKAQGLPRRSDKPPPPQIPRRTGPPQKRGIPNVKKVLAVASGKGGVGKSTVSVNLAAALALGNGPSSSRLRVGVLDLDVFGPSIPTLMGLRDADEPQLTSGTCQRIFCL